MMDSVQKRSACHKKKQRFPRLKRFLRNAALLAGSLLLTDACSGPAVVTPDGRPAADAAVHDSRVPTEEDLLKRMRFWAAVYDQNAGNNLQRIEESHYDLVVIDNYRTIAGNEGHDVKADVLRLKESPNSSGGKKRIISYISIGEASDFRAYWDKDWVPGNPEWILDPDPGGWPGSFSVKYWRDGWKSITYAYLDAIINDGFDGIFMDWVDSHAVETIKAEALKEGKDSRQEMIRFIGEISRYTKSRKPGFMVIALNSAMLSSSDEYIGHIDAITKEELWFGGDVRSNTLGDMPVPDAVSADTLQHLLRFKAAGKAVFIIDYATEPDNVSLIYSLAAKSGFKAYVTTLFLEKLTATPHPDY
jgi:cysteinyl-tRNA synthetase